MMYTRLWLPEQPLADVRMFDAKSGQRCERGLVLFAAEEGDDPRRGGLYPGEAAGLERPNKGLVGAAVEPNRGSIPSDLPGSRR